jgi:hypothetical protein
MLRPGWSFAYLFYGACLVLCSLALYLQIMTPRKGAFVSRPFSSSRNTPNQGPHRARPYVKRWGVLLKSIAQEVGLERLSFQIRPNAKGPRAPKRWTLKLQFAAADESALLVFVKKCRAQLQSAFYLQHFLIREQEAEQGDGDGSAHLEGECVFCDRALT